MSDIYDGRVWKEFQTVDAKPFLSLPNNLAIGLGCDWFQPYKHITYSVGVLYLVIFNLPREERFKMENIILLGIIPGPSEPKKVMNSYLGPFVNDMLTFWEGVKVWHNTSQTFITIRMALICVMCDIPATRKVCGFAGHSACYGCSKCLKKFPSDVFPNKLDYSGYDRESWEPRTPVNYKIQAEQYMKAKTKAAQQEVLSECGVRFSILTQLPYFDIVRMHVVDPMHNLLLGTSKLMMHIWTQNDIISKAQFEAISTTAAKISVPRCVGRIPSKIASSFSGFTADQWRNWTTIYSAVCLKGILPQNHFICWLLYVRACKILIPRTILKQSATTADEYLVKFCKMFETLYGTEHCTINMHLHLHIKDVVLDYGPVYSFWCFSFERFNGILGNYYTNNLNIESQFMKKFMLQQNSMSMHLEDDFEDLLQLCKGKHISDSISSSNVSMKSISLQSTLALSPMSSLKECDFSLEAKI